ncbi:MAG TPA: redoxin domain-containing protein [Sphingobacteriaceae bacterium]
MNKYIIALFVLLALDGELRAQNVNFKIHLRGVYESKVSLQSLTGNSIKTVVQSPAIKGGTTGLLSVPKDQLPGAFILRFDYKEKETSAPYPSEKQIIINSQDLELWVHPQFVNNPDSTYFQKGELENRLALNFAMENAKKKEKLNLLQNFLVGYDEPESAFYQSGIHEFEKRRQEYNTWLQSWSAGNKSQFASQIFQFQYVPDVAWQGTEKERLNSVVETYFEGVDFSDPLILKTRELRDWMNGYVNIYGSMSTTEALRDSLFTLAGTRAIEKAKEGHPLVYGWMVDYFYNGYESFNIEPGIQMLQTYLSDPRCLTSKRLEISKRFKGIETMVPGSMAPDFMTTDASGKPVLFSKYKTDLSYKLVLFWSADCHHCKELVKELYPWYQAIGKDYMDVFAMSLDFTDLEISRWEEAKSKLAGWKHSRPEGGVNSPVADAYYVLSTPVMVLVDSKTNKIVALPGNVGQLEKPIRSSNIPAKEVK